MHSSYEEVAQKKRFEKDRFAFIMVVVAVLLIAQLGWIGKSKADVRDTFTSSPGESRSCFCPETSEEWHIVPDTMDVPDEIADPVKIRQIIICKHGVFFKFHAGEHSPNRSWWLAFTIPTERQYRYCLETCYEGKELEIELKRAVEEATLRYVAFLEEIRWFLGRRYREGKIIHFDRAYEREPILTGVCKIQWRGKELYFGLIPDLYYRE